MIPVLVSKNNPSHLAEIEPSYLCPPLDLAGTEPGIDQQR
jgi:hypothetical protein